MLRFSALVLSSIGVTAVDPEPCTQLIAEANNQRLLCCTSQDEFDAAGDDGNCGYACVADQYLKAEDGSGCEPKACPSTTDVQYASAAGTFIVAGDCGFECWPDYRIDQEGTGCEPEECETDVENATVTGTFKKDDDCGFECNEYWEKSADGESCVPIYCTSSVANSVGTGMLKDDNCDFECDEDYEKVGGKCEPLPCTTDVENAVATGTNEAVGDCSYVCKQGFAKHKTNGLCDEMSAGEKKGKTATAVGSLTTPMEVPTGGKMGEGGEDQATEPVKNSPAGKAITSVVWLVLLGAPLWQ